MPDDNVGWDWSDLDLLEAGQAKYNSVVTQSWQKEVDVSSGGKLSVLKSRMTQVWDASLASGNSSMLHATSQEVSNMNYPSNAGPHHVSSLEARETLLKSFGRAGYPVANMGVQFGSGQMFSDPAAPQQQQGKSRNQGMNPGNNQLFHNSSVSGGMPMNEYINFINNRHQRCIVPPAHQLLGGGKTTNGPHYPPNRWVDGQEPPRLKEKESSLSSFELRLGQPSQQQTQPAGDSFVASLASLPASAVERHKALLFDQVVQRGTLQNNSFCPQNDQASVVLCFGSLFFLPLFLSHGSSSLLFVMKVMVCHFVSNSHEGMTALIVVVEISLQLHQALFPFSFLFGVFLSFPFLFFFVFLFSFWVPWSSFSFRFCQGCMAESSHYCQYAG